MSHQWAHHSQHDRGHQVQAQMFGESALQTVAD